MNHLEIVQKLIGPISPVGETNTDAERFENLVALCILTAGLVDSIRAIADDYKDSQEYSVKRAAEYAKGVLDNHINH